VTLIVALLLGAFAASPRAVASGAQDSDLPFGLQSGLMTAHLDSSGRMTAQSERSSASSSQPYTDVSKFYVERMRAQASQTSDPQPYTDVAKFYVERLRAQASQSSYLAANPELMFARRSYGAAASMLAANPELMIARRSYEGGFLACSISDDILAANPELKFLNQARDC